MRKIGLGLTALLLLAAACSSPPDSEPMVLSPQDRYLEEIRLGGVTMEASSALELGATICSEFSRGSGAYNVLSYTRSQLRDPYAQKAINTAVYELCPENTDQLD